MIHYNAWFNLKHDVEEASGLKIVETFLNELCLDGAIAGFCLLRNLGESAKTRQPRFQALIEFHDEAQFATAFSRQGERGVHAGWHGRMITVVADFRAEIFRQIAARPASPMPGLSFEHACEI